MLGKLRHKAPPLGDEARALGDLLKRYVLQETLDPIKSLGRSLAFGLGGGLLCGTGFIFALIGLLRLLETETSGTFSGNWSFAPYLITTLVAVLAIAALVIVAVRRPRGEAD